MLSVLLDIEVKRNARIRAEDLRGLLRFKEDYPQARTVLLHPGPRGGHESGVEIVPLAEALPDLGRVLTGVS